MRYLCFEGDVIATEDNSQDFTASITKSIFYDDARSVPIPLQTPYDPPRTLIIEQPRTVALSPANVAVGSEVIIDADSINGDRVVARTILVRHRHVLRGTVRALDRDVLETGGGRPALTVEVTEESWGSADPADRTIPFDPPRKVEVTFDTPPVISDDLERGYVVNISVDGPPLVVRSADSSVRARNIGIVERDVIVYDTWLDGQVVSVDARARCFDMIVFRSRHREAGQAYDDAVESIPREPIRTTVAWRASRVAPRVKPGQNVGVTLEPGESLGAHVRGAALVFFPGSA